MTRPHLLVISQYFHPEPFRINDMTREWVKRGYRVTVLTGIPNYPEGRFYEGYSWFRRRREVWNGVEIIRIPLTPRGRSRLGLALNYLSFLASGWVWQLMTKLKADVVFTYEVSPMTQAKIGCWYRLKRRIPHYLYVLDLWPETVATVLGKHHQWLIRTLDRMVDGIYADCTGIFVTSPSFVEAVCGRKVPGARDKVRYWPQYAEEFYRPLPRRPVPEIPENDAFTIVFTGNIGFAQGLDVLPRTARLLKDENVRFVIVGDGRYKARFIEEIEDCKEKFILIDRQPAERIPEILAACNAAFVSFADTELFAMMIPAKLQSYMACGMPIIASARGETERVIAEAGCGICSAPGDADGLANVVRRMMTEDADAMRRLSREYFEAHFEKTRLMDWMDGELSREVGEALGRAA